MTLEQYAKEQAELKKDEWIAEGRNKAIDSINLLNAKLIEAGRIDELKASTTDKDLQNQLLKEFGF